MKLAPRGAQETSRGLAPMFSRVWMALARAKRHEASVLHIPLLRQSPSCAWEYCCSMAAVTRHAYCYRKRLQLHDSAGRAACTLSSLSLASWRAHCRVACPLAQSERGIGAVRTAAGGVPYACTTACGLFIRVQLLAAASSRSPTALTATFQEQHWQLQRRLGAGARRNLQRVLE